MQIDDADVAAEFSKEPRVMGYCDCAVDAGVAGGVPGEGRDKPGLVDSDNWYSGSCCGEGNRIFNTTCKSPERAAGLEVARRCFATMVLPT